MRLLQSPKRDRRRSRALGVDEDEEENDPDATHIVRFHNGFLVESEYVIILELLDWTRPLTLIPPPAYYMPSMGKLYEQNPFNNLAKVALQLLTAVVSANDKNLVHGDIKPENILYTDSHIGNKLKLIDFGNATRINELSDYFGDFELQPPGYRAPEVVVGDYELNEKIDVWSVGVILMELLVNHVFRSFRNTWRLVVSESRVSTVICITRAIGDLDLYKTRKTMFWDSSFSSETLKEKGSATESASMIKSLVNVLKTKQERLALDFILCLIQIDHRKRWAAKRALFHPFLIETLQPIWAKALLQSVKKNVSGSSCLAQYL